MDLLGFASGRLETTEIAERRAFCRARFAAMDLFGFASGGWETRESTETPETARGDATALLSLGKSPVTSSGRFHMREDRRSSSVKSKIHFHQV